MAGGVVGACMAGGMHGRGGACMERACMVGVCMAGGMHGGGHAWLRGMCGRGSPNDQRRKCMQFSCENTYKLYCLIVIDSTYS